MASKGLAHTGTIGIEQEKTVESLADEALKSSSLQGGTASQITDHVPGTSNADVSTQSDDIGMTSLTSKSKPENAVVSSDRTQNRVDEKNSASSDVVVERGKDKNIEERGRTLLSPTRGTSSPIAYSDGSTEDATVVEKNQNNYDINIEAPPVFESPRPIVRNIDASGSRSGRPTIEDTANMVKRTTLVDDQSPDSDEVETTGSDDNILEPPDRKNDKPVIKTMDVPDSTFMVEQRAIKSSATESIASKSWSGNGFTEKAVADKEIPPNGVGVGTDIIREIVREPDNNLIQMVNDATGLGFSLDQILTADGMRSFMNAINSSKIYVVASKSPVPNPESAQLRRLYVLDGGRGVKVHPTQTTIYNLDFDGDGVSIQFETDGSLFRNCMDYLIGINGKPMIDTKFFPTFNIGGTVDEFVGNFRDLFLTRIPSRIDVSEVAESLFYVANPGNKPDATEEELWIDLIRSMDTLSRKFKDRHEVMSYILGDIFDNMLLMKQIYVAEILSEDDSIYEDVIETNLDTYIQMVVQDIAIGKLPPNQQDFEAGLHRFFGEIEGKNPDFRIGADTAKRIKSSREVFVGKKGMVELYELTLEAGWSMFMNSKIFMGEKLVVTKRVIKKYVKDRVGYPWSDKYKNDDGSYRFGEWLSSFKESYNFIIRIVDNAEIKYDFSHEPDYKSVRDRSIKSNYVVDFANAITTVYGDKTILYMFPDAFNYSKKIGSGEHMKSNTMLRRYRNYTLEKLKMNNRISSNYDDIKSVTVDKATPKDVVLAIADKRSSQASKFNQEMMKSLENMKMVLGDIRNRYRSRNKNRAEFAVYANESLELLYMAGARMFSYFGMNNPDAFLESYYGALLYKASNKKKNAVDAIGGVRVAMTVKYRMRHVEDACASLRDVLDNGVFPADIQTANMLQARMFDETKILGSSSDLWNVLAKEANYDTSSFDSLKESDGKVLGTWCEDSTRKFWKSDRSHDSLTSVLIDPAIGLDMKMSIAVDVVRNDTGFMQLKKHEMMFQLEIGESSSYTDISPLEYREQPGIITDLQTSNNKIRNFFLRNYDDVKEEVIKARELYGDEGLQRYLNNIANNPESYMSISDDMICDVFSSQMEKTSLSGEKAKVERPENVFYQAKMNQSGGMTNAQHRSDSRALGMISDRNVSAIDIIQVLADPSYSITVYDGIHPHYELSRETICGGNDISDVWSMLEKNPRVANVIRQGIATSNGKDSCWKNARRSFLQGMTVVNENADNDAYSIFTGNVKSILDDSPMFLSTCAMLVPTHNKSSRGLNLNEERKRVLRSMRQVYSSIAKRIVVDGEVINMGKVFDKFGLTVDNFVKYGGLDEKRAVEWRRQLVKWANVDVEKIGNLIRDGGFESEARRINVDKVPLSFDESSVRLAHAVHQSLTSSKTQTSTGVEGGMTILNSGISLYLMSIRDRHKIIDSSMSMEELEPFIGCETNAGVLLRPDVNSETNIRELEDSLPDDVPLVVQAPEKYLIEDETLDDDGNYQVPSLARMLVTLRSYAAEEGNLKSKKSGDDGYNSVTKYWKGSKRIGRIDRDNFDNIGIVETVFRETGSLFQAKMKLAEILMHADDANGLEDMDLANYADIASVMLLVTTDDSGNESLVVRSIGEISDAIRKNMPESIVKNGTPKEKIDAAISIQQGIGTQGFDESRKSVPVNQLALLTASSIDGSVKIGSFRPARRAAMSSSDRSYKMLYKVANKEELRLPWSNEVINKPSRFIKSDSELKDISRDISKKLPIKPNITSYRFTGFISRNDTVTHVSPGQRSVWFISNDSSERDIERAVKNCYAYGMTLAFLDDSAIGKYADIFGDDITPAPWGDAYFMLPFFDMRMNGYSANDPMAPVSFPYDPSWLVTTVADSMNIYGLGDSQSIISSESVDRINISAGGTCEMSLDDMFYNTREMYPDDMSNVMLCTKEEIERDIVNWLDDGPVIDIGMPAANEYSETILEKMAYQVEEYRKNFPRTDDNGMLSSGRPDQIMGWVKCHIDGYSSPVYAPIIPWPTGSGGHIPNKFDTTGDISIDIGSDSIIMPWVLTDGPEGNYIKNLDGNGAASKSMMFIDRKVNLGRLRNGRPIDICTAAESFEGRKNGYSKRMCTLKTLSFIMSLPPFGFNYAEHDASFPYNPDVRELLRTRPIDMGEWNDILPKIKRFSSDDKVDAILRDLVTLAMKTGTTNPSDILSTKYGEEYRLMYIDYDFFYETGIEFQECLMRWFNSMRPNVCPPDIASYEDGKYLFKPSNKSGDDYGCLQMMVPMVNPRNGEIRWRWENVYISFGHFNDDYSGLHKIGLNGASRTMEQLSAMAMSGKKLVGKNMQRFTEMASAPSPKFMGNGDMNLDYPRFLKKER